jgi:hypothetical protein
MEGCTIQNNSNQNLDHLSQMIQHFFPYAQEKLGFFKPVMVSFRSDEENASKILGRTAHYNPDDFSIAVYVDGRHPKDILRSFSHELVHHAQNCNGDFESTENLGPGYAQENEAMRNAELDAYKRGNIIFRDFEDLIKKGDIEIEIDFEKAGEPEMSLKEWKDNELNGLLMEKWGYKVQKEEQQIFAPNHYCAHHVRENLSGLEGRCVDHNWNERLQEVTAYEVDFGDNDIRTLRVEDLTILEASLPEGHPGHSARKEDHEDDETLEEGPGEPNSLYPDDSHKPLAPQGKRKRTPVDPSKQQPATIDTGPGSPLQSAIYGKGRADVVPASHGLPALRRKIAGQQAAEDFASGMARAIGGTGPGTNVPPLSAGRRDDEEGNRPSFAKKMGLGEVAKLPDRYKNPDRPPIGPPRMPTPGYPNPPSRPPGLPPEGPDNTPDFPDPDRPPDRPPRMPTPGRPERDKPRHPGPVPLEEQRTLTLDEARDVARRIFEKLTQGAKELQEIGDRRSVQSRRHYMGPGRAGGTRPGESKRWPKHGRPASADRRQERELPPAPPEDVSDVDPDDWEE